MTITLSLLMMQWGEGLKCLNVLNSWSLWHIWVPQTCTRVFFLSGLGDHSLNDTNVSGFAIGKMATIKNLGAQKIIESFRSIDV